MSFGIPHPDLARLIAHRDGELTGKQSALVAAHVEQCDECRLELHRLRRAMESPRELAPDLGLLAKMRSAVEQWENTAPPAHEVKQRVAMEIGPFLGRKATSSILQPVAENGENLLSGIEPVLALFLGGKAAGRLVSHVVDAAVIQA